MATRSGRSTRRPTPSPSSPSRPPAPCPAAIAGGPDGNLWFTEYTGNKIGTIDPTTHVITEFALPTANSSPYAIAAGPDGNLWFTEFGGNQIGTINPVTPASSPSTPVPTAGSGPRRDRRRSRRQPLVRRAGGPKVGVLTPTLDLVVTAEPPALVAPGAPFGLTVSVVYQSGRPDTGYNGKVTLALAPTPAAPPWAAR